MKQTFLCAAVLAVLAGAAPFLCLAFPSPSRAVTAAAPASPETAAAPAAARADPGATATQTPVRALTDARLDLLLYDEAAGTVVTVSPVEYMQKSPQAVACGDFCGGESKGRHHLWSKSGPRRESVPRCRPHL